MHGADGTGQGITCAIAGLITMHAILISEQQDLVATRQECVLADVAVDRGVDKVQSSGSIAVKRERLSQTQTAQLSN